MKRNCPICCANSEKTTKINRVSESPWTLVQCDDCTFVYLQNPPDYAILSESFPWEKTYHEEKSRRQQRQGTVERWIRRILYTLGNRYRTVTRRDKLKSLVAQHLPKEGYILELGCGTGDDATILPDTATPIGIEISEQLAQQSHEKFAEKDGFVIHGSVLEGLAKLDSQTCAGAIAKSYLEHEIDPRQVLLSLYNILAPEAPVIIKVPNYQCWLRSLRGARWCGYRFPDHVNYFTPASLTRLLDETGFRLVRFALSDRFPTSDNMWCVAAKK